MKRLYVAGAFLLVCIGLCVYEQILIEEVYKTSTNLIDIAIDYADDEKYQDAQSVCAVLKKYWDKKYPYITSMAEHGTADDAGVLIDTLEDTAENDTDSLHSQLIEAKARVKLVRDTAKISFGNIF